MAKKLKDKPIAVRLTSEMADELKDYLDQKGITMGEMVRRSIQEYMWRDPIKNKFNKE